MKENDYDTFEYEEKIRSLKTQLSMATGTGMELARQLSLADKRIKQLQSLATKAMECFSTDTGWMEFVDQYKITCPEHFGEANG